MRIAILCALVSAAVLGGDRSFGVEARDQAAATVSPKAAVPANAIDAVIDAFRTHRVVALGEGPHGNEQGHAFRLALIRDPRFAATVNDIVVEFGSARYQDVMDRFVNGDDVPRDTLRHVWQDTTVGTPLWDKPIYEEFFRAVRAVNAKLRPERRLRVLLGMRRSTGSASAAARISSDGRAKRTGTLGT
jgi:erythromycin esterase-like protein